MSLAAGTVQIMTTSDDRPTRGHVCVFCGGVPVTEEHVWPEWLSRLLIEKTDMTAFNQRHLSHNAKWVGKLMGIVVKRVCGPCNSGWMSDLEVAAKPILGPMVSPPRRPDLLTVNSQTGLSKWAYKTALMYGIAGEPNIVRLVPRHLFTAFHGLTTPPPSTSVWAGEYDGVMSGSGMFYLSGTGQSYDSGGTDGFISILHLNQTVLVVVRQFDPHRTPLLTDQSCLNRIWPPVFPWIFWPSAEGVFDESMMNSIADGNLACIGMPGFDSSDNKKPHRNHARGVQRTRNAESC